MKHLLSTLILLTATSVHAGLPEYSVVVAGAPCVDNGTVIRYSVKSSMIDDSYIVDVWTPEGYSENCTTRYPVIYAEDGQNLFDAKLSFANVAWELDCKAQALVNSDAIMAPIIVGINNRGNKNLRANDYFPERVLDYIPEGDKPRTKIFETCKKGFYGDEYASFVAKELKPLIDALYNTDSSPSHTFAMGSSMGGLLSLYLMCEYPETFGGAACMSTHWIGSLDLNADYTMNDDPICANAILAYMDANLPSPHTHKLYLDQGTTGWDSGYLKYESSARAIAETRGYSTADGTLMTYDATGAGHNEWYWQQRAEKPLEFLLGKEHFATIHLTETTLTPWEGFFVNLSGIKFPNEESSHLPRGIYVTGGKKIIVR